MRNSCRYLEIDLKNTKLIVSKFYDYFELDVQTQPRAEMSAFARTSTLGCLGHPNLPAQLAEQFVEVQWLGEKGRGA